MKKKHIIQDGDMPRVHKEEWVETDQSTLLDAFIYLTRQHNPDASHFAHSAMTLDMSDNAALRFLMHRLDMDSLQIHILSCVLYHNQANTTGCDMDDLNDYMGVHPLTLLSKQEAFNLLVERGYW